MTWVLFWLIVIVLLVVVNHRLGQWLKTKRVAPQPGRTVSRVPQPGLVRELPPALDETAPVYTYDFALQGVPESIRADFDLAHMPCTKTEGGLHQWDNHQVHVQTFSDPVTRTVGCWVCRACKAHTKDDVVVATDQVAAMTEEERNGLALLIARGLHDPLPIEQIHFVSRHRA